MRGHFKENMPMNFLMRRFFFSIVKKIIIVYDLLEFMTNDKLMFKSNKSNSLLSLSSAVYVQLISCYHFYHLQILMKSQSLAFSKFSLQYTASWCCV